MMMNDDNGEIWKLKIRTSVTLLLLLSSLFSFVFCLFGLSPLPFIHSFIPMATTTFFISPPPPPPPPLLLLSSSSSSSSSSSVSVAAVVGISGQNSSSFPFYHRHLHRERRRNPLCLVKCHAVFASLVPKSSNPQTIEDVVEQVLVRLPLAFTLYFYFFVLFSTSLFLVPFLLLKSSCVLFCRLSFLSRKVWKRERLDNLFRSCSLLIRGNSTSWILNQGNLSFFSLVYILT